MARSSRAVLASIDRRGAPGVATRATGARLEAISPGPGARLPVFPVFLFAPGPTHCWWPRSSVAATP